MWQWKAAFSCGLVLIFISYFSQSAGLDYDDDDQKLDAWGRCPWIRNKLKNGRVRIRSRGRIAKFSCKSGYDLVGKRFATCVRGQWNNPIPLCITKGCRRVSAIANGKTTESNEGAAITFDCNPGYTIFGDSTIYCDGKYWDKDVPKCQVATQQPQTSCDFEDPDICGWSHDPTHDFDWRRNQFGTPSGHVGTGPSYDHTYGTGKAGYYMYGEASAPRNENDTSRLFSPVYSKSYSPGCFVFWYHMYGATIGALRIYVKKESAVFVEISPLWEKEGDQGNHWLRGNVTVPPIDENFQIVIEGIRGSGYVGDTAVDDVNLNNTDCSSLASSNSTEDVEASEDSCRGRCHEIDDSPICGCTDECESNYTCCSDYSKLCGEKTEATSGEEDYGQTTVKLETEGVPETTAADEVGTPLTVAPPKLSTKGDGNTTASTIMTNEITQQSPVTANIPRVTTVLLSTGVVTQATNRATTTSNTEKELTTQTATNATLAVRNVTVDTGTFHPQTAPNPTTKDQATAVSNLSTILVTAVKASTAIHSTTTATTTTTAATVKQLTAVTQTSESRAPPEGTSTNSPTTSRVSNRVPTTVAATTVVSSNASLSTPTQEITNKPVSSKKMPTSVTHPVAVRTTPTIVTTVSEILSTENVRPITETPEFSSSSPKIFPPYTAVVTAKATSDKGRETSMSLKTIPATSASTTPPTVKISSAVSLKTTTTFIPTPEKTIPTTTFPSSSGPTVKNTVRPITKQVSIFLMTTSLPTVHSPESGGAHASKAKADIPENSSAGVAGICIGVLLIVCLFGGVAYVYLRRRRQAQSKLRDDSEIRFLSESEVIEYSDASSTALVMDQWWKAE